MDGTASPGGAEPGNGGAAARRRTGFVYDPACLRHDPGRAHPERSARLTATMERLEREPWFRELEPVSAEPCPAEGLESVHAAEYVARAE